jgi:hypothetical protein
MSQGITEQQITGKRFRYVGGTRSSRRMTLRKDHRLEGAPSIHEHSWAVEQGALIFRGRNGQKTLEFTALHGRRLRGRDLTSSPPREVWLIEEWRARFSRIRSLCRRARYALNPRKRPRPTRLTHDMLLDNSLVLRFGRKTMRWCFQYGTTREDARKLLLPWTCPDCPMLSPETPADFSVGVYLEDETIQGSFADLAGMKFLLSGEKETRHPRLSNCWSFVQDPQPTDDATYVRYAPTFYCWTPPRDVAKSFKCSVVDNGQYAWRVQMIEELARKVGDVDIFGKLAGRRLGGYHDHSKVDQLNQKYLGLERHCFYLSIERAIADDYITEKFTDAIMCNAIPIYDGAPNIHLYAHPGSYIPAGDVAKIDWNNWRSEYERRLPALRAQKELMRTRLNLFSYFHCLTENMSLLDRPRPIALQDHG